VTAAALLDDIRRCGATATLTQDGRLRIDPASVIDAALLASLKAQRDDLIIELTRRDPATLIAEAHAAGLKLEVEGVDGLRVCHRTNSLPDAVLIARLGENKPAIITELRRQASLLPDVSPAVAIPTLSGRGIICRVCKKLDRCYTDSEGTVCPGCAEWRGAGCAAFTVLERADEAAEARYCACLSCGGSIELHGSPDASKWRRVTSLDDVEIAAVRYVLASAGAIAREARR
jgi:hypothetical protein